MKRNSIDVSYLRQVFAYSADTGSLIWRVSKSPTAIVGSIAGTLGASGYRIVCVDGQFFRCHRIAFAMHHGHWPKAEIDHINRNRDDNRACNLRDCSRRENSLNRGLHANNRSGFRGVSFDSKRSMWIASLKCNGKNIFLGRFATPEAASEAYRAAALLHNATSTADQGETPEPSE